MVSVTYGVGDQDVDGWVKEVWAEVGSWDCAGLGRNGDGVVDILQAVWRDLEEWRNGRVDLRSAAAIVVVICRYEGDGGELETQFRRRERYNL